MSHDVRRLETRGGEAVPELGGQREGTAPASCACRVSSDPAAARPAALPW